MNQMFVAWQVARTESDIRLLRTFKNQFLGVMKQSQRDAEQACREASVWMAQQAGRQDTLEYNVGESTS